MAAKKLTRFEKARILGARALQLSMGAKPQVDISKLDSIDPIDSCKALAPIILAFSNLVSFLAAIISSPFF
jgi:hypothetical protein